MQISATYLDVDFSAYLDVDSGSAELLFFRNDSSVVLSLWFSSTWSTETIGGSFFMFNRFGLAKILALSGIKSSELFDLLTSTVICICFWGAVDAWRSPGHGEFGMSVFICVFGILVGHDDESVRWSRSGGFENITLPTGSAQVSSSCCLYFDFCYFIKFTIFSLFMALGGLDGKKFDFCWKMWICGINLEFDAEFDNVLDELLNFSFPLI